MKQKHTLQWISAVTGRAKGLVGLLVVVQTVLSVSSIAFAFVLRRIINMAVQGASTGFRSAFVLLVGVIAAQIALSAASRFLSEYTTTTVENRFKQRLFSALLTGNYASVTAVHSGEWMNRLTSDTTVVAGGVTQIVSGLIGMLVRLLGAVTAILWLEPRFLYILLPRRRGHDAADLCVPQDIETTAQEDSRNRRCAPGVLTGAAGKSCHRPHLCQGRTDDAAGRRPDG